MTRFAAILIAFATPAVAQPAPAQPAPAQPAPAQPAPATPVASPALQARIARLPAMLGGTGDYAEYFAPAFRAQVSPDKWAAVLAQIATAAGKPVAVASVEPASADAATVRVRFERGVVALRLVVDPAPPHAVAGLLITGITAAEASVGEVVGALKALPGTAALSVARLGDAAPVTLHRLGGDRSLAIGSEFKLVILAELVRGVTAGQRRWDDMVTLDGGPLPGGGYTQKPAGTRVSLRELAQAMIAVSDNSATDILIHTLGRDAIEAMVPRVGIAKPAGMRPFLTTLEVFKVKALVANGKIDWAGADEAGRRRLLAGPVAAMPLGDVPSDLFAAGKPLSIDSAEWFATPDDMIRVMDWLRRATASGPAAEARAILAKNPGIGPAAAAWRYVGYKGGSEPGVIAMTLLLQSQAGGWYAVSAALNDPARAVDDTRFAGLMTRLTELLAQSSPS